MGVRSTIACPGRTCRPRRSRRYPQVPLRPPQISHVIPQRSITDRHQKPRNINDLHSNIDRSAPELRATISNNHRQPVARGTQMSSSRHSQQSSRCLSAGSYRAPNGAVRLVNGPELLGDALPRQKAPSAIRCIKTRTNHLPHLRRHTPESTERLSTNTKCPLTPHRTREPTSAKPTPHRPQTRDTTPDHTQTDRPTR